MIRPAQPNPPVQLDDASSYTAEGARSALTRERSRLASHRAALQKAAERAEERTTRLADIAQQLGTLDQELESFSGDLRLLSEGDLPDELKKAARTALFARREAAVTAIEHLRNSLILLEERGALIPLEVDLAQRKVIASEDKVALLENIANGLRQRDADESLAEVIFAIDAATAETPELVDVATETKALAAGLWGEDGVVDRSETTVKALMATRKHVADIYRIVELTRRKFEAFGHRGSLTRWWPDVPEDMPDVASINLVLDTLSQEIPEVQHQLITFEEARTKLPEQTRVLLRSFQIDVSSGLDDPAVRNARSLLTLRRDLLDQVILEYGRYSTQLVELRSLSTDFRDRMVAVEFFLYSQILWSRSVPKPIIPRVTDVADAAQWLMSPQTRRESLEKSGGDELYVLRGDVLAVLLLITVLIFHRRIKHRLAVLSDRVADPTTDRFRYTLEALFWTATLALPLPLLLFIAGGALFRGGGGAYFNTAARALRLVSTAILVLGSTTQLRAQSQETVESLRAFAKLYGYVRWFHPSDEAAELDWEAFAAYGAAQVKNAGSPEELRDILQTLFLSFAPTVQIYGEHQPLPPPPPELSPPGAADLDMVAWQHSGVGFGDANSIYRSARLNRETTLRAGAANAVLTQGVDVAGIAGKEVRLTGMGKALESGARVQLWLRVDLPDRGRGFFDNMMDRPVVGSDWTSMEIQGPVAENAAAGSRQAGEEAQGRSSDQSDGQTRFCRTLNIEFVRKQKTNGRDRRPGR